MNTLHIVAGSQLADAAELLQPGFGKLAYQKFDEYNAAHFSGELEPRPIIAVPVAPYGHWVGLARGDDENAHGAIYLQQAGAHYATVKVDDYMSHVLLHEMIHHWLYQRRENSKHNAAPWCREIMRIGSEMGLPDFWASPSSPRKIEGRSVRQQKPRKDGMLSLPMTAIARFPHTFFSYHQGKAALLAEAA
jgi:hypothetical protein